MGVFEQFPLLTVFVIALVGLLVVSMMKSRQAKADGGSNNAAKPVACPKCQASPPAHAKYCNRCGQKL